MRCINVYYNDHRKAATDRVNGSKKQSVAAFKSKQLKKRRRADTEK
jgi:hypothetical protein